MRNVFSHLSKLSHGNLRFAPGLKLSLTTLNDPLLQCAILQDFQSYIHNVHRLTQHNRTIP